MSGLVNTLNKIGPGRLFGALGVTAIVAAALFALMFRVGGEEKALLFSDVAMSEAAEITGRLDQAGIAYELRGDGTTIFVPRSKVLSARLMLSAEGLPSRGSVGYEIFDKQDALGATQFQQNINHLRALEGELARTIASIRGVKSARVHLVLPERRLFEKEEQKPTASIVIEVAGESLSQGQVRAVRNLVASAVPGLTPNGVTVADNTGRLLASAQGDDPAAAAEAIDERQAAIEQRLSRDVTGIVESIVGPGNARVQVTADIDFNRVTQVSQTFDPEGRVVKEQVSTEETNDETEGAAQGAASAQQNLPGAAPAGDPNVRGSKSERTEESVKYEISNSTKTEVIEGGRIKRLSVAVAVDGVTTPGADGAEPSWAPRDQAELDRITALVQSAVGFDEARGDKVEVVNLRFARPASDAGTVAEPGLLSEFGKNDLMRGAEIAAALIAGLAVTFFVLRPLAAGLVGQVVRVNGPGQKKAEASALAATSVATLPEPTSLDDPLETHIDIARIQGQVKASSVKRVSDLIEQSPEESAQILRNWLAET